MQQGVRHDGGVQGETKVDQRREKARDEKREEQFERGEKEGQD